MVDFILWGATGQAKVLHEALVRQGDKVAVLVDNRALPSPLDGIEIVKGLEELRQWLALHPGRYAAAAAIAGAKGRDRLQILNQLEELNFDIPTIRHEAAFIALDAITGEGCQILAQAAVCSMAKLGRGVIINTAASVDHDCVLGDGVHIGPGARLAGEIEIGDCAFIGTGAIILPRLRIGADAVVGAGAVVTKDVASGTVVKGNPACAAS